MTQREKQLKEERSQLRSELETLRSKYADSKEATLSEEDATRQTELLDQLEAKSIEIRNEERAAKLLADKDDSKPVEKRAANLAGLEVVDTTEKEMDQIAKRFNFGAAVRGAYGETLDGVEAEMHQEGKREMQSIGKASRGVVIPGSLLERANVTVNSTAGIQTLNFVDAVYANTILGELGVTTTRTNEDQRIPIIGAVTTQWEGETDAAADGGSALSKKDLSPTRLASYVNYSKQAAMQHNDSLEAALRRNIIESMAAKIEYAVFTDDTGNGGPADIGAGKTAVTSGTAQGMVLALMEEVLGNNHNKGRLGFACSDSLFSVVHQAAQISGVKALYNDGMVMGKPFLFSSQIADIDTNQESIYYGDWSKLQMAQFGGVEILFDPYTQAVSGMDRLVLNSYWDFVLVQDAAISVAGYTG